MHIGPMTTQWVNRCDKRSALKINHDYQIHIGLTRRIRRQRKAVMELAKISIFMNLKCSKSFKIVSLY
jgi:hypothetical protein